MCEAFLEPHHVASRRGSRAKVVLGSAGWGRIGLTIGPGGPQRLLILCGNPPPKAAGSFVLLAWGRANDRTLCGGTSPGGSPRRGDALAFLPQGEMTFGFREDGPEGATDWVPGAVYASRCAGPLPTGILFDVKSPDKRFCGATARTRSGILAKGVIPGSPRREHRLRDTSSSGGATSSSRTPPALGQ